MLGDTTWIKNLPILYKSCLQHKTHTHIQKISPVLLCGVSQEGFLCCSWVSAGTRVYTWSLHIRSVASWLWAIKGFCSGHLEAKYWIYTQEIPWRQWKCRPSSGGVGYLMHASNESVVAFSWWTHEEGHSACLNLRSRYMDGHRIEILTPIDLWKYNSTYYLTDEGCFSWCVAWVL